MKTYIATITTTFTKKFRIEAPSASEAQLIAEELLGVAIDCEPDTSIEIAEKEEE